MNTPSTHLERAIEASHLQAEAQQRAQEAENKRLFAQKIERRKLADEVLIKLESEKPLEKTPFQIIGRGGNLIVAAKFDEAGTIVEMFVRANGQTIQLLVCNENFLG